MGSTSWTRQHAAALAYGALRRCYERSGGPMRSWRGQSGLSDEAWQAVRCDHASLIRAAGAERFVLDRLCLDEDAPCLQRWSGSEPIWRVCQSLTKFAQKYCIIAQGCNDRRNHELGVMLMPRYHFDTECGDLRYEDPDGVELKSIDQAHEQLLGLLRDLTLHDDMTEAGNTVTVEVKCDGSIVLQGSCSLVINRPAVWSPKL